MVGTGRGGFIVRVLRAGSVQGTGVGFIVGERHVVTCAHVVNAALGRGLGSQDRPGADVRVQVDFPLLGDAEGAPLRNCRVEAWVPPPAAGVMGGDVAGLVLLGEGLPGGAAPAVLADLAGLPDAAASVFGYPAEPRGRAQGDWSALRVRGAVGGGVIQLDSDSNSAIRAQPGYSGSPVVVPRDDGEVVAGMLAVAGTSATSRDAYAVPVSQLADAWPDVLGRMLAPPCPYRGLLAFTADDAAGGLFVGREEEIARLREMIGRQSLVVVAGPSGAGKSSLISAGLIPALRDDGWATGAFRPGDRPVENLARALLHVEQPGSTHLLDDLSAWTERLRAEGLAGLGAQLALLKGRQVVLLADQLEEILDPGICPAEDRKEFLDLVLALDADAQPGLRLVCTLRADFLSPLLEHPDAGALLRGRMFMLSPMGPASLRRVTAEPAAARGVRYADGLAELIAHDAGDGRGLPLLEFALTELWPHQRHREITLTEYNAIGGVDGALRRYAEEVSAELSARFPPDQVRRALLSLVRSRGGVAEATRRIVTREQLGADWPVADALASRRLVVLSRDTVSAQDTAEIAHEALIRTWPDLASWVEADAKFQHWLAGLEERAAHGDLLDDTRLGEADRWLRDRRPDIPAGVLGLIERSKSEWHRRVTELEEARSRAERSTRQAEARRVAAAAELALTSRTVPLCVPVALAVESLRIEPTLEGGIAARHAIRRAPVVYSRLDHDYTVNGVVFSRDGTRLLTRSDNIARVIDVATGAEIHRFDNENTVNAAVFSKDGTRIATAIDNQTAYMFDTVTGRQLHRFDHDDYDSVTAVTFGYGYDIATGCHNGGVRFFDAETGRQVWRVDQGARIEAVAFEGGRLLTGNVDGSARLFDTKSGKQIWRVNHDDGVTLVAFSDDGERVAIVAYRVVRVLDAATGRELHRLDHEDEVHSVAFNPYGSKLATGSGLSWGFARVFDATGDELSSLKHDHKVNAVAFGMGARVATASEDGTARVFNAETGVELCRLEHEYAVNTVAFSSDERRVATGSSNNFAQIFDSVTRDELSRIEHRGPVRSVAFSPDGAKVATASEDDTVRVFDPVSGDETFSYTFKKGIPYVVTFSPDGTRIAAGGYGGAVILDAHTGGEVRRLERDTVHALAFSSDGTRLILSGTPARVVEASTGAELCRLGDQRASAVVLSADGTRVATRGEDAVRIFDAATGTEVRHLTHRGRVYAVAFSGDGTWVVTGSADKTARVFDAASGAERYSFRHGGHVTSVAFSADGARIATASSDEAARVFDAATGTELHQLGHDGIQSVAFSADGTRLVTGSEDGTARVFNVATGTELCRLEHDAKVESVTINMDGTLVAVGSTDRTARVWLVEHGQVLRQAEQRLTRNLYEREWRRYFPDAPYRKTRPDLP